VSFTLKQNDREPPYECQLTAGGDILDLTGCTVEFLMSLTTTPTVPKVQAAATIVGDPTNGTVSYQWGSADTDTIGTYRARWLITYASGHQRTVPSAGYLPIDIETP